MSLLRDFLIIIIFAQTYVSALNSTIKEQCPNAKTSTVFVRKRRHLDFPTGSAATAYLKAAAMLETTKINIDTREFLVTTSIVKTFMTHVPSGWFTTIEAELVFKLPDATFVSSNTRRKLHHRQKKEVWETLQSVFEHRNMNSRNCMMRTICEAQSYLAPKGRSLVHDLLRAMFTAPLLEPDFVEEMGLTYGELLDPDICGRTNDCPFSVIGFLLDLNKQRI